MEINKELLDNLFEQAKENPRLRQNLDLRTSSADTSQRMLNALLPGTVVPIHRHPMSTENVLILCGKLVEVLYDVDGNETERILLDPSVGNYGCVVPQGVWHSVEVLEPSVIYEAKDGKYGEDGSETFDVCKEKQEADVASVTSSTSLNAVCDLKEKIEQLVVMERKSGSMDVITPLYVARMLNVPVEEVERVMKGKKNKY